MNDNYAKFKFEIQFLHACHESNGDSVYTVNVYKIYYIYIYMYIYKMGVSLEIWPSEYIFWEHIRSLDLPT